MMSAIYFYGHSKGPYACFSNFYKTDFSVFEPDKEEIVFCCSEQYLMYKKAELFGDKKIAEKILKEENPATIKKLGRQVSNFSEEIWAAKRYKIMKRGLLCKFRTNPELKKILLGTGTAQIYEAAPRDKIWGIGYSAAKAPEIDPEKYGQNLLGRALMSIRKRIKNNPINLAIVGSRDMTDIKFFRSKIKFMIRKYGYPDKIISGGASGADSLAEKWAAKHDVETVIHKAEWSKHGNKAGPIRNKLIVDDATHVLAFPSKIGKGTQNTISLAEKAELPIEIFYVD